MLFDRLATKITRHYKMIVVLWIVALLISVPAILQVGDAVEYETSFGSEGNQESVRASEIIAEEFQSSVANGTLIVVLQADNITDASSRDFVLALQERIQTSQDLRYLLGTSSIYSYSTVALEQVILELGPAMRPAEQNITFAAFLLWGVPAIHAANWNTSHSDSDAYNATSAQLSAYLSMIHADANTTAMAFGYYNAFASAWNVTAIPDPSTRATVCVQAIAPTFINSLPADQATVKAILTAVLYGFNLTNYNDPDLVHAFSLRMIGGMASITNTTFLEQVYDMGPTYNATVAYAFAQSIVISGTLATYPYTMPEQLVSNFVSPNNKTMVFVVTFSVTSSYVENKGDRPLMDDVQGIRGILASLKADAASQITTYVTGDAAISADLENSAMNDMKVIAPITIIIIIVLMGLLFRSLLGQFLPLGAVGIAVGMSQALVFVIGTFVAPINYMVSEILFVILMGVGTDYSIFIITRYREERIRGATREQAVHTSVTWAGESIVTSGATVVIAFSAMALSSFSMVQTMGLVIGLSIIVALLVALTLIPAILMLVGNRIFWPTSGRRWNKFADGLMEKKRKGNHGYFYRAASFSVKHAKVVIVASILVSIPTTYLFMTEQTSFDFIGSIGEPEGIQGMNAMTSDFGAGRIMPTQIAITGDTVVYDGSSFNIAYLDAVDNITAVVAVDPMVKEVTSVTRPYGELIDYHNLSSMQEGVRAQLTAGMLQSVGSDNTSVLLTVVLKDQPEKASSVNWIPTLRSQLAEAKSLQPALASSTILVGGTTASTYDMGITTTEQFNNIEILVVIGIFLVLMVVLGSLLLPLFAVVSIAMSITWAFAATSFVFGTLLGAPILWLIPLILFVILMGIGMDYNVFILTRIREEVHKGKEGNQAIIDAVDWTGGIITALALIMAGAFGSIMISSNTMLQEFGFALAIAVLLDAMVVRTYIVPAALTLMGKWAWWAPGRLQREGRDEMMKSK